MPNAIMIKPDSVSTKDPKFSKWDFEIGAGSTAGSRTTVRCSIVLLTGGDLSRLDAYLLWLNQQALPQDYEVIIINDRALDLDENRLHLSLPNLKVLSCDAALNLEILFDRGANVATGRFLLFIKSFVGFDKLILEESIQELVNSQQKASISSNGNFILVEKCHYAAHGGFASLFGQSASPAKDVAPAASVKSQYLRNLYNENVLVEFGPGTFIDPEAIIDSPQSVKIGSNCTIRKGVVIRPEGGEIIIGDNCVINHYCVFHGKGGIYLGDWTIVAPHCGLYAQNHTCESFDLPITKQPNKAKGIYLMGDNWIGAHSVLCDDVTIGKGAVVGANSTVTKSIPMASIAAGTPARVIRKRYEGSWDFHRQERASSEGMPQQMCRHVHERAGLICELVQPQDSVLDVGCGEGIITAILSQKVLNIVGCDYSTEAVEIAARQHPNIEFVYSNSTNLVFADSSFTKVVLADVAEHLMPVQLIKTLKEIKRVLKTAGVLILTTPTTGKEKDTSTYAHIYEYAADRMQRLLSDIFGSVELVNRKFGIFLTHKGKE